MSSFLEGSKGSCFLGIFFQILSALFFSLLFLFFIHAVIPNWFSSDSETLIILIWSKMNDSELPIYRVHLCPMQNEVIVHLHSERYFQRIPIDAKILRAISYHHQITSSPSLVWKFLASHTWSCM